MPLLRTCQRSMGLWSVVLLLLFAWAGGAWAQEFVTWPRQTEQDRSKIQYLLEGLIAEARSGQPLQSSALSNWAGAEMFAIRLEEDQIQVVIEATSESAIELIAQKISQVGGRVELTHEALVQAMVPFAALDELANLDEVTFLRLPVRPQRTQEPMLLGAQASGSVTSEGLRVIGTEAWHQAGFNGEGIKIAIEDSGFRGYTNLLGRELPPRQRVVTRSFRADRDLECRRCGEVSQLHGLAVAEIAYDVAPGATFYLVNSETDVEARQSVDWLIDQKVDVINTSWAFPSGCFRQGGGIFEPQIAEARQKGITWVTAAGNEADIHWEGTWRDSNFNNQHEFASGDENITLESEFFEATIEGERVAALSFFFIFSWDADCTEAGNDYNLILFPESEPSFRLEGDWLWRPGIPIKAAGGLVFIRDPSLIGTTDRWNVVIRKSNPSAPAARLDLLIFDCSICVRGDFQYLVPEGSVSIQEPSISPNAMTVGAVHHSPNRCSRTLCPDGRLLFYSSRGPTKDGRIKPDIAAPTHVSTTAFGRYTGDGQNQNPGFTGTSAATPHVTGAAALFKGAFPNLSPQQLQERLEQRAEDSGAPGKDNSYGAGVLFLGQPPTPPAPTITKIEPASGVQGSTVQATISGTNLSGATAVTFSGSGVTAVMRQGGTDTVLPITITIAADAAPGARTFSVTTPGGTAQSGAVTFTVVQAPRLQVEPDSLSFQATEGQSDPPAQTLRITNAGGGTLSWQATVNPEAPWLSLGTSEGTPPSELQVTAVISGLAAGIYAGQITITAAGAANSPVNVPVTLTVEPAAPKPSPLTADPSSLNFEATAGGANPAAQSLQLTNAGTSAVTWNASVDVPWLKLDLTEGTLEAGASTVLSITVEIAGLPAGTQQGRITFGAEGFEPLVVPVTLALRAPTTGELIALKFVVLEFVEPADWERTQREGCVVYTNVSSEPSLLRVTLPDDTIREFEIPVGNEVIVCGDVVHIDTR